MGDVTEEEKEDNECEDKEEGDQDKRPVCHECGRVCVLMNFWRIWGIKEFIEGCVNRGTVEGGTREPECRG